jgi:two-component system cell cycle sensor histidine kinase/response regulator CckA
LEYSPGTETILLVEDEELLCHIVAEMLGDLGYRVLTASNGTEALSVAQTVSGDIHVLITDVLMPEMDGTKLAESLRSQRPTLKVLFVTGDSSDACPASPGVSRLNKPFSLKMLSETVRELLKN